ncbi:protein DpdF [Micromonospora rubida]|uniref:protein DpdF n=1 Tax=Micromonospora rubida TaxID=2697657 RepID=UPI001377C26A|nr:protein DpdF [Micromonospora rubida]NBE85420.1 DEAD/DEAH box helicase [Micromonospora rubida]
MTRDDLATAQQLLEDHGDGAGQQVSGTCRRLRDALRGSESDEAGWYDVAALVRQILLEQHARTQFAADIRVSLRSGMPTREQWEAAGCVIIGTDGDDLTVAAKPWLPPHGDHDDPSAITVEVEDVYRARPYPVNRAPADPFWTTSLGHSTYTSLGQRQAARTIALAPPGTTAIVCLPTGQGKTDVILAPIIAAADQVGVSVVVVPTVVLAIDMERRVRALVRQSGIPASPSGHYAYLGDIDDDIKQSIRAAIRDGRQRIVFAAPEAVVTGLSSALQEAAGRGLLRYVVIDEAHLVEQWGTEFRPDFQTMAAQRLAWLAASPESRRPMTVAMSATLTDDQVAYLAALFRGAETTVVWASALRKEPAYYVRRFANPDDRQAAVLDALGRLPRPIALYVTKRKDVSQWVELLADHGIRRVGHISGESTGAQRREVVEGWRGGPGDQPTRFDVVVGTSAFGLGIDMAGVRSVVHSCMPETIDRFYQEVGRAGRDGAPSVSLLAVAPADIPAAAELSRQKVITAVRGWTRWERMAAGAVAITPRIHRVDLDSYPADMADGAARNRQWNIRTLNLMARSNLIALLPALDERTADASGDPGELIAKDSPVNVIDVEFFSGDANRESAWLAKVAQQRSILADAQQRAWAAIEEVLADKQCIGATLSGYYGAEWHGGRLTTELNCRGCPHCRTDKRPRLDSGLLRTGLEPHPGVHSWANRLGDPLREVRGSSTTLSIYWRTPDQYQDQIPDLMAKLVRRGLSVVGGPGLHRAMAASLQTQTHPTPVIVDLDSDLLASYQGPLIWWLDRTASVDAALRCRLLSGDVTYLVHPEFPPGERNPLTDFDACQISAATALGAL